MPKEVDGMSIVIDTEAVTDAESHRDQETLRLAVL